MDHLEKWATAQRHFLSAEEEEAQFEQTTLRNVLSAKQREKIGLCIVG